MTRLYLFSFLLIISQSVLTRTLDSLGLSMQKLWNESRRSPDRGSEWRICFKFSFYLVNIICWSYAYWSRCTFITCHACACWASCWAGALDKWLLSVCLSRPSILSWAIVSKSGLSHAEDILTLKCSFDQVDLTSLVVGSGPFLSGSKSYSQVTSVEPFEHLWFP